MLAIDSTHLYWTENELGTAWKAKKDGSEKTQIFNANKTNGAWGIAAAGDTGVWITSRAGAQVVFVPKNGGASFAVGTGADPYGIATRFTGGVWQPIWTTFAGARLQTFEANKVVTLPPNTAGPTGIAVDSESGRIYWTTYQALVWRTFSDGTGVSAVTAANNVGSRFVVAHDQHVYFTDSDGNAVWTVQDDGTSAPVRIADDELEPWGITGDETGVYWVNRKCTTDDARCIRRARIDGQAGWKVESLGGYVQDPIGIVVDSTNAYVISFHGKALYKLSK